METKRHTVVGAEELLGLYFPVLDHGFVALVDYMGGDSSIDAAARNSYGAGTRQVNDERNLIRYMMRKRHTSPTEMVELKFHCRMPIFVARQWIRHRTASVNDYSGRYSVMPLQYYTPEREQACVQSTDNRQGRAQQVQEDTYAEAISRWQSQRDVASDNYKWLLSSDVARELARIDLPLSTYTEWYWKIDLHNLLHFLSLRVDSHAQHEIRVYGNVMAGMVARIAPHSYEAWIDYRVCGRSFSRGEMKALSTLINGGHVGDQELQNLGLSKRETKEFWSKLELVDTPTFDLDLEGARPATYFKERVREYTPNLEA